MPYTWINMKKRLQHMTKYYYTKIKGDSKYILQLMQHDAHTIEMDVGYYVLPECTE